MGDGRAFEVLVRRYIGVAHGIAQRTLGPHARDADDVVQDAMLTALERIDDCDAHRFRAWLLTIVRNHAHNRRKSLERRAGIDLDRVSAPSRTPGPFDQAAAGEFNDALDVATRGLTDLQRQVFRLHDIEGRDHGEVAARMGISRESSRFNLFSARKALRRLLSAFNPT